MSLEPPEWVFVWYWLRFMRHPQVMGTLPAQAVAAPMPIPHAEYERYRDEWLELGAPKVSTTQVLAAIGVGAIADDDDGIPF